jgi:hypothetical protein
MFMDKYKAEKAQSASIFLVELPSNRSVASFLDEVWTDYANAVEPGISEAAKIDLFRLNYVDAMNLAWYNKNGTLDWKGEHRPHAVLVPEIKFRLTQVEMQKTTFPMVARAQTDAGIKIPAVDESGPGEMVPAAMDSLDAESLDETASTP